MLSRKQEEETVRIGWKEAEIECAVSWLQDIYHYAVQSSEEKSAAIRLLPFVVCVSLSQVIVESGVELSVLCLGARSLFVRNKVSFGAEEHLDGEKVRRRRTERVNK
ncbi:hypothetical protein CEXT_102641 [Caerostris extrusa]|uniref:Uncharacterized protein n=1 Tax=Caerostris extrusa TaxID=172846 RepID=A0AAV4TSA8_CAEEX|nr:hypothetical protein CEXT_102641 [Caerostris extrusa]